MAGASVLNSRVVPVISSARQVAPAEVCLVLNQATALPARMLLQTCP